MRLKDKSRKERVQRLAPGMLASSIFQWKLSLGQESVLTPTPTAVLPPQMSTHVLYPKKKKKKKPSARPPEP